MFSHGKAAGKARVAMEPLATLLGEGTHWQGEIHAGPGGLRVEGEVEGTILSEGVVVVGPTGRVRGAIHARNLTVNGRVEGVFRIQGCLEILGSGWVEGEVELEALVVDEGGTLQGTCTRRAAAGKEPVPLLSRREEALAERATGTHAGAFGHGTDPFPAGRTPAWHRP